jgi:phosphate-selective porin OprO/OprP
MNPQLQFVVFILLVMVPARGLLAEEPEWKERLERSAAALEALERQAAEQQKEIAALRAEIERLRSAAGSSAPEPASQPPAAGSAAPQTPAAKPLAGWERGRPFLQSSDGEHRMEITALGHLDFRGYTGTATPANTFVLRRARLRAQGYLFRHLAYSLQGDFADTDSRPLRDGFLNFSYWRPVQVQFGQFKPPISGEFLQSSEVMDFVERSLMNNLVPARSPGVMVHGTLADGIFGYQFAAMNGLGELKVNTGGTPETSLRLRVAPWAAADASPLEGLAVAGSFTRGRHRDALSVSGETETRSANFFESVEVNGEVLRAVGEAEWIYGPASLRAGYAQTLQGRENLGPLGEHLPGVVGKGLYVSGTYLLTGEAKAAEVISPRRPFASRPGRGAWEAAFRYARLRISSAADTNLGESITFGVNWWLNPYVRYQSNIVYERFEDPARAASPGRRGHVGYLGRMQFRF